MTDLRPVCVSCSGKKGHIVRLVAKVNGVYLPYAHSYITADLWECPECKTQIAEGFSRPHYPRRRDDPDTIEWRKAEDPDFFPLAPEVTDEG